MATYLWVTPCEMPHISLDLETTRSITRLRDISPNSSRERIVLKESNCLRSESSPNQEEKTSGRDEEPM